MDDLERGKIAEEVGNAFSKANRELSKSFGKPIDEYIQNRDDAYRTGRVEELPDSFGLRLRKHLLAGGKPSEFFRENMGKMKGYISEELLPYFYTSVDSVNEWQVEWASFYRRSYRGKTDYTLYLNRFPNILDAYRRLTNYGCDIYSLYTGQLPEKLAVYLKRREIDPVPDYYLAARLDEGDEKLEELITGTFYEDTEAVNVNLIRGILMSHNEKMYEVLGKTLVAARLSEGLRQAICENMDFGTPGGFLYLLRVILENDLVRFASIKRSLATFTGIYALELKDESRIAEKTIRLIAEALTDESSVERMLASEDSMEIFTGLWSIGLTEIRAAMDRAVRLSTEGSRHQRLVACYFLSSIPIPYALNSAAKEIVRRFSDDDETLALIMPRFMERVSDRIFETLYPKRSRYNYVDRRDKVSVSYGWYFDSPEECREFSDLLYTVLERIPKKGLVFEPSVFPWHRETLSRANIAIRIIFCASALQDDTLILKAAGLLPDTGSEYSYRADSIELLLRQPDSPDLLRILTEAVADPQDLARDIAFRLMEQEMNDDRSKAPNGVGAPAGSLPEMCYDILENMLRLKKADIRANVLKLLASRGPEEKLDMLRRLLSDKKEEKVTAALDIILQLKKDDDITFPAAAELIGMIAEPTTKEKILMDEIQGGQADEKKDITDFYDKDAAYTPVFDEAYLAEALEKFDHLFPDSEVPGALAKAGDAAAKAFLKNRKKHAEKEKPETELLFIRKLDDLIEEHKNDEYDGWDGKELLGNGLYVRHLKEETPFQNLWDALLSENPLSDGQLMRLRLLFTRYGFRERVTGYLDYFAPLLAKMFGPIFAMEDAVKVKHLQQISAVIGYYSKERNLYVTYNPFVAAVTVAYLNITTEKTEYPYTVDMIVGSWEKERADPNKDHRISILEHHVIREVLPGIRKDDRSFPIHYALKHGLIARHVASGSFEIATYAASLRPENGKGPHPVDFIGAAACGYISTDFLYKTLLDRTYIEEAISTVSNLAKYIRESDQIITTRGYHYGSYRQKEMVEELLKCKVDELEKGSLSELQQKKFDLAEECYERISRLIMEHELVRGDTETEFSNDSLALSRVYGLDYFVRILSALGSETLDRASYFYNYRGRAISKRESLSHLLSVCIPDAREGDTKEQAEKLGQLLKETDIKESRLIEAGLYSPEWLPIIGEYLGWEGFMSGCYYFMAHMNEKFDEKRAAIIAKYTPLTEEELNVGAFDVSWFREVYETLGKKRFDAIYQAAKYISDGAKHTRARKYADASRGDMDPDKTAAEIEKKRNKDLLMSYALIPCPQEVQKERYSFIQKYLRESKQFGAQRRASEKAAAEMALKNLAAAAGYADETRFTLKMEREISSGLSQYFEPHEVGEYLVWLEEDEEGKIAIATRKGDKLLKSLPAAIKKNEYVLDITEAKKSFTEQYRRTRIMMEEAMEAETEFYVSEILDMYGDRVIGKMIGRILFKQGDFFGFPKDFEAAGLGPDQVVTVAHPWHLFKAGRWHEFQKICFEQELKQPFRQIFRELYVKTDEEKNLTESRRYAGNQINPKKTVSLLRSRRWIADEEDGLQKVYYKENIIATIYAMADWFSPSDIEEPTLEWVAFYDRKTFKAKTISEIPDILFSEVMRDVDLAVSVAHAGEVDPEMSHSTIEMRRAIAEFVIPMFKLTNVTFTDSHALIKGERGNYNIHLGSGVIHQEGGPMIQVLPVHSQNRGRIFLPFVDDDPKTAEIMAKIIFFAEDKKIKDPFILNQIV